MKKNRKYLTYTTKDGDTVTLVFRTDESLNKHIELYNIDRNNIMVSDKPPKNPEVTDSAKVRMLEFLNEKERFNYYIKKTKRAESIMNWSFI